MFQNRAESLCGCRCAVSEVPAEHLESYISWPTNKHTEELLTQPQPGTVFSRILISYANPLIGNNSPNASQSRIQVFKKPGGGEEPISQNIFSDIDGTSDVEVGWWAGGKCNMGEGDTGGPGSLT